MSKERIYFDLCDYLSLGQFEVAQKVLDKNIIDVTYDNGVFFDFTISKNNLDMLNSLLEYYEKTQLQGDSNSFEYKVAKHKLQQILQNAANTFNLSKEVQAVLDKYLPKEEDSDQELDDLEDIQIPYFPNNYASAELTEDNLKRLDDHHEKGLDLAGKDHQILDTY